MGWGRGLRSLLGLTIALLLPQVAGADLIFAGLIPPPDILANNIQVNYVASTDSLTASGTAAQLNNGMSLLPIAGGSFQLTAMIDGSGNLSSGSLMISGNVLSGPSGLLLSATVVDVGFLNMGGDPLQFLVNVTGGALAGLYPSQAGVELGGSGFSSWGGNFSNNGTGVGDTAPIPEPGTGVLLGLGLVALAAARSHVSRARG